MNESNQLSDNRCPTQKMVVAEGIAPTRDLSAASFTDWTVCFSSLSHNEDFEKTALILTVLPITPCPSNVEMRRTTGLEPVIVD